MAQAMFRDAAPDLADVESAGVEPWDHLHPMAVKQVADRGLSFEGHVPKHVDSVSNRWFDCVVTIGDPARARLPKAKFSASFWMHWGIGDPADADGTPDSDAVFRRAADAIAARIPDLIARLKGMPRLNDFAHAPGIGTGLWAKERFNPGLHLPAIRKAGFPAIELNLYKGRDHFDWDDAAAVGELRRVTDAEGMLIWSIHSPDLASMASADPAERRRQIDVIRRCLDLADELGSKAVPSHALLLAPFKDDPEGSETRMSEAIEELTEATDGSCAQIAFENAGFPAGPQTSAANILARLDRISRAGFGFVLDTGHSNIDGDLDDIERMVGDHLITLHLNDNDSTGDTHLPPGQGTVDWEALCRTMEATGYLGVVMYEIERGDGTPGEKMDATIAAHRRMIAGLT